MATNMSGGMGLSANEDTVESVLSRNYRYTVPDYQRRYAWREEQWGALWDDVTAIKNGETHFLGSIVVIERTDGLNELNQLEVVDGQQRLATISIILSVIRERYVGDDEYTKQAKAVENDYLWEFDLDQKRHQNLELSTFDNSSFRAILEREYSEIDSEQMKEALKFFGDKIDSLTLDEVDSLRKRLLSSVTLVTIECNKEQSAFRLFETLNDRGLELSAVDLMKNHLFSIAANSNDIDYERVQSRWQDIITNTVPHLSKPSRFFRHHIMSAPTPDYNDNVSEYKLFDVFKEIVDGVVEHDERTLEEYVKDMSNQSCIYYRMSDCDIDFFDSAGNTAINSKLNQLNNIKSVQARTLLLRAFREFDNPNKIMEVLNLVEKFLIQWKVANYATGSQFDRIHSHVCSTAFERPDPIDSMQQYLSTQCPSDAEFRAGIENKRVILNDRTKYMLAKIEREYYGGEIVDLSKYDIEHIAPRSSFSAKKYSTWSYYLDTTEATFEQHRDLLGNLTLLESDENVRIGNNPFENKTTTYRKSDISMTNSVAETYDEWGIEQINERTSRLAEAATGIWSLG
ncbi:DUF262 domain-containing protein [Halocatena pleomorpha]|nr:DUF262 domain-containing protein [Halocatena pleomorpha]